MSDKRRRKRLGSGDSEGSEDSEGVAGDEGKGEKDGASSDPERDEGVVSYQIFQRFDALLVKRPQMHKTGHHQRVLLLGNSQHILAKSFCILRNQGQHMAKGDIIATQLASSSHQIS